LLSMNRLLVVAILFLVMDGSMCEVNNAMKHKHLSSVVGKLHHAIHHSKAHHSKAHPEMEEEEDEYNDNHPSYHAFTAWAVIPLAMFICGIVLVVNSLQAYEAVTHPNIDQTYLNSIKNEWSSSLAAKGARAIFQTNCTWGQGGFYMWVVTTCNWPDYLKFMGSQASGATADPNQISGGSGLLTAEWVDTTRSSSLTKALLACRSNCAYTDQDCFGGCSAVILKDAPTVKSYLWSYNYSWPPDGIDLANYQKLSKIFTTMELYENAQANQNDFWNDSAGTLLGGIALIFVGGIWLGFDFIREKRPEGAAY